MNYLMDFSFKTEKSAPRAFKTYISFDGSLESSPSSYMFAKTVRHQTEEMTTIFVKL
jgi:hypothetical protein